MRLGTTGRSPAIVWAGGLAVVTLTSVGFANVYPSGVTVESTSFNTLTGTAIVNYFLNENADGDGVNPGVKIEVLDAGAVPVRTVPLARQRQGKHVFEWDGRNDAGDRLGNGSYSVRITASDYGYTAWIQISVDDTAHSFWQPLGVAVNKNPTSRYYGRVYVSNNQGGTTAFGRATTRQIYMLNPDGTEAGAGTAGVDWALGGGTAPFKSMIGSDDRLYVTHYSTDTAFEIAPDLSSNVQILSNANRTANQWVGSVVVTGTQAGGDRKLWAVNTNVDDTARKGLIMYDLGSAATATGTGVQYVGPGYFAPYYPMDFAIDSVGDLYACQFRFTPGQAPPLSKFLNAPPPINTAQWAVSNSYAGAYGIDIDEPRNRVAYGDYYTGFVRVFDMTNGALLWEFDAGTRIREVAFDAAGNLYTGDNSTEWLRVWSPPDGPNSKSVNSGAIGLQDKAGSGGPILTDQPDDLAVCPGQDASFTVAASGSGLSYQWKKNGQPIGTNAPTLSMPAVAAADDGAIITCVVADANGVAVSDPAILTVGVGFVQAPLSTKVCANSNAEFVVSVNAPNPTYQWQRTTPPGTAFTDIQGATGPTLSLPVTAADNNTQIRCRVTAGACGTADSPAATITVSTGPALGTVATSYVTPNPRPSGGGATFYAIIVSATGPVSYQWYREGEALVNGTYPWGVVAEATGPNLVLSELGCTASGKFTVAITDNCGTTTSVCNTAPGTAGQVCYLTVGAGIETCNNGVDDDCDNAVDCADSDCSADPFCGPNCHTPFADWDEDGDVDMRDFADFQRCYTISGPIPAGCECFDYNNDDLINTDDATRFVACGSGPGVPADPSCDDRPTGQGKVVINEVVYNVINTAGAEVTDQFEFVELYNRSAETIDISGWILKASDIAADDNRDFQIPGGVGSGMTLLGPGGYYVFTAANVPLPAANPPQLVYTIVPNPTDIWENGPDVLELLDGNKAVIDSLIYARSLGTVAATGEGSVWGALPMVDSTGPLSLARWLDGRDLNSNGYDFGLRAWTPGTSNLGTGSIVVNYTLPAIDALSPGAEVSGLDWSFQSARVIDPADSSTTIDSKPLNPSVIPASPQGGKAVVAWDFATGGGNAVFSRNLMQDAGGFDLWVYLDTSFTAWGTDTGRESTTFGVMGTTDTAYNTPDPDASIFAAGSTTANGNTGLCWIFNKVKGTSSSCKLYLVDAGPGGTSTPPNSPWAVRQTIDMTGMASGWYRLSISYNGTTGAVVASGPNGVVNFNAATGLAGGFYVGYRETTGTTENPAPAYLRPATFDSAP